MGKYNVVDNNELVELIERGLRKGYWDKALIPELKKRFKEIEKKEKLLDKIKDIVDSPDYFFYSNVTRIKEICQDYIKLERRKNNE